MWEAKREGVVFELPAGGASKLVQSIDSLLRTCPNAHAAILQAQKYCSERGCPYAVVSNSFQIIVFLAVRMDGIPPLKGQCLVFNGFEAIRSQFTVLWQALSPEGITDRRLSTLLRNSAASGIPRKPSSYLTNYPRFRYPSAFQQSLRVISELLLEDAPNTPDVQQQFYEHCYCESGALAQEALISRDILLARYAALFPSDSPGPTVEPADQVEAETKGFRSEVIAEALGRRPIVLIGDVGVGKTSFLRHLFFVRAVDAFKNSIFIHIDLGSKASLAMDLRQFILAQIEHQFREQYSIDIHEDRFVRAVHLDIIQRFDRGINQELKKSSPDEFNKKLIAKLEEAEENGPEHLRASIRHIAKGRRRQVVIAIDNTDQRSLITQQEAFVIAQDFAQNWEALVFISLRPATFHQSHRSGTLSAYPQRVLTISPPRPDLVLERRLVFALDMAEGRLPIEKIRDVSLKLDAIVLFIKALLRSLRAKNSELTEFLSNISGGNIRQVIELVTSFLGSANVESERIVEIMRKDGRYVIPLHEFSKTAILGEYAHYNSESSVAFNVFDVRFPDRREHFLPLLLLCFIGYDGPARNREGFVDTKSILTEAQDFGFTLDQVENALRRLTNKKLIETTQRVTFDEGVETDMLIGEMPSAFRLTTVGAYHRSKWVPTFGYLDAMLFDTPIFDETTLSIFIKNIESFDIAVRLERAEAFRSYLLQTWDRTGIKTPYFDWRTLNSIGDASFESVRKAVTKQKPPLHH